MIIKFHKSFTKNFISLRKKERDRFYEKLEIFEDDPYFVLLNNHPLHGKYEGYRSISIGGDLRAIYKKISFEGVIFVKIGTHNKLYK